MAVIVLLCAGWLRHHTRHVGAREGECANRHVRTTTCLQRGRGCVLVRKVCACARADQRARASREARAPVRVRARACVRVRVRVRAWACVGVRVRVRGRACACARAHVPHARACARARVPRVCAHARVPERGLRALGHVVLELLFAQLAALQRIVRKHGRTLADACATQSHKVSRFTQIVSVPPRQHE
eukprot:5482261-Pleurochrysis_carterae.AAC.2